MVDNSVDVRVGRSVELWAVCSVALKAGPLVAWKVEWRAGQKVDKTVA